MLKILSLFDGMSCGQIALQKLGITEYEYYASEIDKYAMQVTKENFPNTIHIGDVTEIRYFYGILKGEFLEYDVDNIDLLLGGSPCQGFSFAGKQLAFDDPRSKLFFEYVRILKEVKPRYFLLENVKMKKEFQDIISEHLFGIQPTIINSALVSAQNRVRLYWVGELQENGSYKQVEISQPIDKLVTIRDILEDEVDESFMVKLSQRYLYKGFRELIEKAVCMSATMYKGYGNDGVTIINRPHGQFKGSIHTEKSPTIRGQVQGNILSLRSENIYKLTPTECERLQTVPDGYTEGVSNSQRYKMLGNGWTVDVIAHILSHLKF